MTAKGLRGRTYPIRLWRPPDPSPSAVRTAANLLSRRGRIVIIDKNKDHWGRLETPEWERWFGQRELESMLRKHCRPGDVTCRPVQRQALLHWAYDSRKL